jgi:glycosyltransferase involved in cell wall biosynthesis
MPEDRPTSGARVAVLVSFSGDGGVENMIARLVQGFLDQGTAVDVLLIKERGGHARRLPTGARVLRLDAATSLMALPAVVRYLRRERPQALLAAKDRAGRIALLARRIAGVNTRIVLRLGMHLSGSMAGKSALYRWSRWLPVRLLYPKADAIVTVARAMADDFHRHGGIPRDRFTVIPNPSIPPDLGERCAEPVDHPWLAGNSEPVILGVGRLKPQKDFATLLRAFARLRERRAARLVILGEGPERATLQRLAGELGIGDELLLPGFVSNPLAWMRRADVFVLSSAFEGAPNVLVEALACGTPAVATDCPSGPREILADGALGPLVPVGDDDAMAQAIEDVLDAPPAPEQLRAGVADYTVERSSGRYLGVLLR